MPTRRSVKGEKVAKIATKKTKPTTSSEGSAASLMSETPVQSGKEPAADQTQGASVPPVQEAMDASVPEALGETSEPAEEKPAKKPSARPSVAGKRTAKRPVAASKPDGEEGDASADAAAESVSEKGKAHRRSVKEKKPLTLGRKILLAVGGVVLAFVLFVVGVSLDRWVMHDDKADLQDAWYVYDSLGAVVITDNTIELIENTNYKYTIDTTAKTIHYTIGNLSGDSHYRFSPDRNTVALIEDGKQVFTATLIDDLGWWMSHLGDMITGKTVLPGELDNATMMLQRKS